MSAEALRSAAAVLRAQADALDHQAGQLTPVAAPAAPASPVGALLTKKQTCAALQISTSTIDRLVVEGAPVHVVGTRRRFDVAELRAWLAIRGRRATVASGTDPISVPTPKNLRLVK